MAKSIYAVKVFLLREQFRLTAAEVVRMYAIVWFRTPLALDLTFENALRAYPDKELSKATVLVFGRYL